MTKSFISICIFFSIFSSAELLLEITQGSDNPINLGIYEISSQGNEDTLIKNIIQNDLIRTGEIKFIERSVSNKDSLYFILIKETFQL